MSATKVKRTDCLFETIPKLTPKILYDILSTVTEPDTRFLKKKPRLESQY